MSHIDAGDLKDQLLDEIGDLPAGASTDQVVGAISQAFADYLNANEGDSGSNDKVKVRSSDGEAQFLNDKISAGNRLTKSVGSLGGVESMTLNVDDSGLAIDGDPQPHDGSPLEFDATSGGVPRQILDALGVRGWRFYKWGGFSSEFSLAFNAEWDESDEEWKREDESTAMLVVTFYNNGIQLARSDQNTEGRSYSSWDWYLRLRPTSGEVESDEPTRCYVALGGWQENINQGVVGSCNFRKKFLSSPSGGSFIESTSGNFSTGPTVDDINEYGAGLSGGNDSAGQFSFWYGTFLAS